MSTRHADITTDQYTAARKPPLFDAARCPGDARRRRWSGDGPGPAVDGPIEGGATDEDRARDEDRGGERELVPLPSSRSLFATPAPVPYSPPPSSPSPAGRTRPSFDMSPARRPPARTARAPSPSGGVGGGGGRGRRRPGRLLRPGPPQPLESEPQCPWSRPRSAPCYSRTWRPSGDASPPTVDLRCPRPRWPSCTTPSLRSPPLVRPALDSRLPTLDARAAGTATDPVGLVGDAERGRAGKGGEAMVPRPAAPLLFFARPRLPTPSL